VMPFVAGSSGLPFRTFVAWSAPACVLWSVIYVPVYALAGASLRDGNGASTVALTSVVVAVVLFVATATAQRLRRRRVDGNVAHLD
jgi:membrane-associated protein